MVKRLLETYLAHFKSYMNFDFKYAPICPLKTIRGNFKLASFISSVQLVSESS